MTTTKAPRTPTTPEPAKTPALKKTAGNRKTAPVVATSPVAGRHKKPRAEPERPRQKLIRDSFTIPKSEFATLETLKLRAATLAHPVKKSEILRAGIAALNLMGDKALLAALARVPSLKTGRPPAGDRPEEGAQA